MTNPLSGNRKWYFLGFVLLVGVLIRYRNSVASTLKGVLPAFMQGWLGLSALAIVAFGALTTLDTGTLFACVSNAPCGIVEMANNVPHESLWHLLEFGGGAGALLGISQFVAPDTSDLHDIHGDYRISDTPSTSARSKEMFVNTETTMTGEAQPRPYLATSINLAYDTTIDNSNSSGSTLRDDDMCRIWESIELYAPEAGQLLDKTTCTGPIVGGPMRFISNAYSRQGDFPMDSIAAGASPSTYTAYLTHNFAQRWLTDPLATCPWLGLLKDAKVTSNLAANGTGAGKVGIGAVSSTAVTSGTSYLRGYVAFVRGQSWFHPMIPYWRVHRPAVGSDSFTLDGFGDKGPECTFPVDLIHTILFMSSLKGLGGPCTIDNITEINCAALGLPKIQNMDAFMRERVGAQYDGAPGTLSKGDGGNWSMAATNAGGGMSLATALWLALRQPSLNVDPRTLAQYNLGRKIKVNMTVTTPLTGSNALLYGSLRLPQQAYIDRWRALSGNRLPPKFGQALVAQS